MNNEPTIPTPGIDPVEDNQNYIDTIKTLQETTVSKDRYEKLKAENKQLLDTLVSGGTIEAPKEKVDVKDLRKDLFYDANLTNLEFCRKSLELRDAIIEAGGVDPFLPNGKMIAPDYNDVASANKVAEALQSCIETADGDPQVFTMELQRIMRDAPIRR